MKQYAFLVKTPIVMLARAVSPRFPIDILNDDRVIKDFVYANQNLIRKDRAELQCSVTRRSIIDDILDESSLNGLRDDEFLKVLSAAYSTDRVLDPLMWWKSKGARFPAIGSVGRTVMAVQRSSVTSESAFSLSGKLIADVRESFPDS